MLFQWFSFVEFFPRGYCRDRERNSSRKKGIGIDLRGQQLLGFLRPFPFSADEIFTEAERLSHAYTARSGNRSLDVLHVACARISELKVFASFDDRQRKLAEKVGLRTVPAKWGKRVPGAARGSNKG